MHVCKNNTPRQSLPRVGKVASGASRIGFWRYEREEEDRLKCVVYESTLSTAARSPFPNGEGCDTRMPLFSTQRLSQVERRRGGGFAAKKESQPRLAALGSPFQGKGLAWSLPPSYGRRYPEGAEVGWEKRYERERGRSSQVRRLRKHPIHR